MAASAGLLASAVSASAFHARLDEAAAPGLWSASVSTLAYVGLAAAFVKAGAGAIVAEAERRLAGDVANRLRVMVVSGMLRTGSALPAPRILASLAVRLREVEAAVSEGVLTGVRASAQLVPLALCLIVLSSRLAALAVLAIVPFAALLTALRRRARHVSEQAQCLVEHLECGVDELVRNADLFRTFGATERVLDAVSRAGERACVARARVDRGRALLSGANEVLGALAVVGLVSASSRAGLSFPSSSLVPFLAVLFMAYRPLRDLGDARGWVMRGGVALVAVRGVLAESALAPPPAASGTNTSLTEPERPFPNDPTPFLELVELGAAARGPRTTARIERGEIVALVGPTGAGKTTLLRALLGLEASCGRLLIEGVEVTHAPAGPGSRPFSWVPQEAPLVTGTVVENVLLVGGSAAEAQASLEAVGASRLAAEEDSVGPGGRPLSGGERRQVALARALATGLPVMLLDEPTEGLDAEAARSVRDAIAGLRGARTVIVATHRDDVVALADRVLCLGEGRRSISLAAE